MISAPIASCGRGSADLYFDTPFLAGGSAKRPDVGEWLALMALLACAALTFEKCLASPNATTFLARSSAGSA